MHLSIRPILFSSLALLFGAAPVRAIPLDLFTDLLPVSPCLPNTGARVVFIGPYCDGVACPPDPWARDDYPCSWSDQDELPGVLQGVRRFVQLHGPSASTIIRSDVPRLEVLASEVRSHSLFLTYFDPDFDLDFVSLGVEAIGFDLEGDMSPSSPIEVGMDLWKYTQGKSSIVAVGHKTVTEPGRFNFSLADFDLIPDPQFTEIDEINIVFYQFQCETCSGARNYSIGPITLETNATPTTASTWGQLKSRYR